MKKLHLVITSPTISVDMIGTEAQVMAQLMAARKSHIKWFNTNGIIGDQRDAFTFIINPA